MRKITSTIIGIAIATILTTYLTALTLSNLAFAQRDGYGGIQGGFGKVFAGQQAKTLGDSHVGTLGFHVALITKFKAHKDNPTQIIRGIGSGIGVLHKFTP
ncbi:MAG TPA: hypothetical protein VN922_23335 [Bacteroidia bacterium]|nr:hypothetical protein [Bacteroidia bacterium]